MNNQQYELEFERNIEDWYVDQSPKGGAFISSIYTPHGIKQIDSQYCNLIQNINNKIKQVYRIARRPTVYSVIKTREVKEMYLSHQTYYDPIELSDHNGYGEIRIEWETGFHYDFYYGTTPLFDVKSGKVDPDQLRMSIKNCPNLHVMIKENLLLNLDNYLKEAS